MALIKILTDESPMPFGQFRGTKMANVPAWYLLKLNDKPPIGTPDDRAVREYIADVMDWLLAEQKQAKQNGQNYMFNPYK